MLYYAYQAQCDALAPLRLFAETARGLLNHPGSIVGDLPLVRGAIAVSEEAVALHPFCRLVHFRKAAALDQPKLLVVAPLSGHFSTLLRGTIAAALPDHDVYLTD